MNRGRVIPARRRGACPSLPEPMPTGDGLLARLVPMEALKPDQLAGLAQAARQHGNGIIEVTARGSLQVRGLSPASAPRLASAVAELGIAIREGLTVQVNPLAGRMAGMAFDPRALAAAIARAAAPLADRLAPKLSVIVDGGGPLGLGGLAADIRLSAAPGTKASDPRPGRTGLSAPVCAESEVPALLLSIAAVPLGHIRATETAEAVALLLGILAARGPAARGRDIPLAEARAALAELIGHDLSPSPQTASESGGRGGAEAAADRGAAREGSARTPVEPLSDPVRSSASSPAEPVGLHRLVDGGYALGLGLAFGHSESAGLEALAEAAGRAGADAIEPAPGRALLIAGLSDAGAAGLRAEAAALGFITDAGDPRRRVFACPGRPACASAFLPARAIAAELAPGLAAGTLHVSGCAKGCAHPGAAGVTIVGLDAGAGLVVEGSARALPARIGPVADIVAAARSRLETSRG